MIKLLLVLVLIALIAVIVSMVLRGRRRPARATGDDRAGSRDGESAPMPRDPFGDPGVGGDPRALKAGDLVEYLARRYFVRGSLRLSEGGYAWSEHFLDDTEGTKRWISVEEDPDLEVVLWVEHDHGDLTPDRSTITVDGVEYRRDEHGTANYRSEGTTGLGTSGSVEYVDYEGSGGRYLSFERFGGGEWESGLGERVPGGSLTIYPGSGQ